MNGKGSYIDDDNNRYDGTWENGNFNGKITYKNGREIIGLKKNYANHEGHCEVIHKDGRKWTGDLNAMNPDAKTGQGVWIENNGDEYDGVFDWNDFDGTVTYALGYKY